MNDEKEYIPIDIKQKLRQGNDLYPTMEIVIGDVVVTIVGVVRDVYAKRIKQ